MSNFFKQRLTKTLSEQSGIALIEILVVVGIVVALALDEAIVLPFYSSRNPQTPFHLQSRASPPRTLSTTFQSFGRQRWC